MSLSSMYSERASIDEAIEHCLEMAARNEIEAKSMGHHFVGSQKAEAQNVHFECAANHRQLAEWLTEYKALREENINLKNEIERLRDCVDNCVHNGELDFAELKEAKRLLKAAVEDLNITVAEVYNGGLICKCCKWKSQIGKCCCPDDGGCDIAYRWRYVDEALKLIGGKTDEHS